MAGDTLHELTEREIELLSLHMSSRGYTNSVYDLTPDQLIAANANMVHDYPRLMKYNESEALERIRRRNVRAGSTNTGTSKSDMIDECESDRLDYASDLNTLAIYQGVYNFIEEYNDSYAEYVDMEPRGLEVDSRKALSTLITDLESLMMKYEILSGPETQAVSNQ
jgi:hypothetical protein